MDLLIELLLCLLLLLGGSFAMIGSWGLLRLPDFFTRLHAPTKATTLGLAGLLLASMIHFTLTQGFLSVHELLIALFLLITAPVSAHMLAKTALHHRLKVSERTGGQALMDKARERHPPHN